MLPCQDHQMNALFFTLVLLSPSDGSKAGSMDLADIESRAVRQRMSINSGHVKLRSKVYEIVKGARKLYTERSTDIWFDGDNRRADIVRPLQATKGPIVRDLYCMSGDKVFAWLDAKGGAGSTVVMVRKRSEAVLIPTDGVCDPRLLGLIPVSSANLLYFNSSTIFGLADRSRSVVEQETRGGKKLVIGRYKTVDQDEFSVWYSPDQGHAIVRVELVTTQGKSQLIQTVDSDLQYIDSVKMWFPKTCAFKESVGGEVREEEEVQVEMVELGSKLGPEVFTLAGLGIHQGTRVQDANDTSGRRSVWNGSEVVEERQETPPSWINRIGLTRTNRLALTSLLLVLSATLALYGCWRLIRSARPSARMGMTTEEKREG